MEFKTCSSIEDIPAAVWDGIFASQNPFVKHAWLVALESSGCVQSETGWQPHHMLMLQDNTPVAAMPLYVKRHSWGEFVFDWAWAEAYQRIGLDYYPKLLTAIPNSPVAGPRIGVLKSINIADALNGFINEIQRLALIEGFSGWHLLFADETLQAHMGQLVSDKSVLHREAVQFHWFNQNYGCFDDFLQVLRSSRRKNMKRERRKIAEQGVQVQRRLGKDVSDAEWHAFYLCYQDTNLKRSGHSGYLNQEFFQQVREQMPEQIMLVVAYRQDKVIAASLFLFDQENLYGRYWGALEEVSYLHFEACFYQGIEFCIERGLTKFDPGTQGEHKLIRGFEPVKSASYHWIADSRFRTAIADFVEQEKSATEKYRLEAQTLLPYK